MSGLLSLKARLACIFILLGVLCIGVAAVGVEGIQNANARAQRTYDTLTRPAQAIESSYIITTTEAIQLMEGLASSEESTRQQRLDFIEQLQKDSDAQFVEFLNSPKADSIKDVSSRIKQDHAKFAEVFLRAVELFREGKTAES